MRSMWKKGTVTVLTAAVLASNIGSGMPIDQTSMKVCAAEVVEVPLNEEFDAVSNAYFELTEAGVVTFECDGKKAETSVFRVLEDGNEKKYAYSASRLRLAPGKYNAGWKIDKINFTPENKDTYEKEWNDTLDTANEIKTNIAYTGNLNSYFFNKSNSTTIDKDYYKFELQQGGLVQVQYSLDDNSYGNRNVITLYSEDEDGNISKICEIDKKDDKTRYSERYRLPKGRYYVGIEGYVAPVYRDNSSEKGADVSDYQLKVSYEPETSKDHEQEYNNTKDTANEILTNTGYTGNIPTIEDKDYYKFTIPTTSVVKLKMQIPRQSQENLFHVVLYKGDATSKITDLKTTGNPTAYSKERLLEAGTYYVLVEAGIQNADSRGIDTKDYTITVDAKEEVAVQNISIEPGKTPAYVGDTFLMKAVITPEEAGNKTLTWESSDQTVATIDQNGKVTCKDAGNTYITATAQDGSEISARFLLNVVKKETSTTDTPASTIKPSVTSNPYVTQVPTETKSPIMTAAPVATKFPIETESPEEPIATAVPIVTKTPEMTVAPVITEAPKTPGIPIVTGTPAATETAKTTVVPAVTEVPKETGTPVISATPDPTEAVTETKMPLKSEEPIVTDNPSVTNAPYTTGEPTPAIVPTKLPKSDVQPTEVPSTTLIPNTTPTPTDNEFADEYVKSIVLSSDLEEGEEVRVEDSFYVYAEITPEELEDTEIIWSTSDEQIATVNEKGKVTCVGAGTVTITATATDGSNVSASMKVTVLKAKSKNNYLSKLSVSQGKLTPAFKKTRTSYSLTLKKTMSRVTIKAALADKNANITINGKKTGKITLKLKSGESQRVTIKVKAENGATKTYKIRVKRK